MLSTSQRIFIVGPPGSGKTTLENTLAAQPGIPAYELDVIHYQDGYGPQYPYSVRQAEMARIATTPAWIVEGGPGYLHEAEALLQAADCIVWLDLPWRIVGWRILARHIKADLARNNRHPGYAKLFRFFLYARQYYKRNPMIGAETDEQGHIICSDRATTQYFLEQYRFKLIHCRTPKDVALLVSKI